MIEKFLRFIMLPALLLPAVSGTAAGAEGRPSAESEALVNALRSGGYILYARHGEATVGEDRPGLSFDDCSAQRNLDDAGREQARRYGDALRMRQIPVAVPVLASPFCRTRQTAEIAFGIQNVAVDESLAGAALYAGLNAQQQQAVLSRLGAILESIPPTGTNRVVVAHGFPAGVAVGDIPFMGTVVIKPRGPGRGYDIAGRLTLEDLTAAD